MDPRIPGPFEDEYGGSSSRTKPARSVSNRRDAEARSVQRADSATAARATPHRPARSRSIAVPIADIPDTHALLTTELGPRPLKVQWKFFILIPQVTGLV